MVFRSRTFRKRAYSIYLCAAAIADLHYFNWVLITRILQNGLQISIMNRYTVICKLRQFSTVWGNVVDFILFSFVATSFYVSIISNIGFRRKIKMILKMEKDNKSQNHTVTDLRIRAAVICQPNYR